MKEIQSYPPNIDLIRAVCSPDDKTTFTYGDAIYNPHKVKITPDLEHHEEVHQKQQGSDPDRWWNRYLTDPEFRLSQEIEAYRAQYQFAKAHGVAGQLLDWVKEQMAFALSGPVYGNMISYQKAEYAIRQLK